MPSLRPLTCLGLLACAALVLSGCIQDRTAPDDLPASVTALVDFSPGLTPLPFPALIPPIDLAVNSPMGLRAAIAATGPSPLENDNQLVNNDGSVTVMTRRAGPGFVVVRGANYDIAYGLVDVGEAGSSVEVEFLRPFDGADHPRSFYQPPTNGNFTIDAPNCDDFETVNFGTGVRMLAKEPGRAKFMFFADDPVGSNSQGRVEGRGNDSGFPVVISVFVIGDFNEFALPLPGNQQGAIELLDEGSHFCPVTDPIGRFDDPNRPLSGDERAGDRVFTRYLHNLPKGEHRYAFVVNQSPLTVTDPYEEKGTRVRVVDPVEVREFAASIITIK